jgi:hypothetical protein
VLACIEQKCVDPCPGTCGANAKCDVRNHSPICTCIDGYTGNPFTECTRIGEMPLKAMRFCASKKAYR